MKIYLLNGPRAGDKIELLAETTIGRELDNHISVMTDGVSRYHAKFIHERDGSWSVCDLNSTNGSKLNGSKIKGSALLKEGDVVEFGDQAVRVGEPVPEDIAAAEAAAAPNDSPTVKPKGVVFNFTPDGDSDKTSKSAAKKRKDSQPVLKPLSSGQTPKVVFKPVDTMATPVKTASGAGDLTKLDQEEDLFGGKHEPTVTMAMEDEHDEKKGEHEHLADMLNKVSLFGGKGKKGGNSGDGATSNKRRRSTNLLFYTLVICAGVIAVGVFLILQKQPDKKPVSAGVKKRVVPFLLVYKKRICTRDNVFQFSLRIENDEAHFSIDDLKSRRKFTKNIKHVKKDFIKIIERAIDDSDFMKLKDPAPATARDDVQDTRVLLICYKGKLNNIHIVNTLAPTSFDAIERAIDDFAVSYHLQTISMTPEELIEKARKFFYKAESLYMNREANPANLRKALVRYNLTVDYLDQFSPKPEIWHKAMEKRKKVAAMLKKMRSALIFDYGKLFTMREFKKCLEVLDQLMLISEPGSRDWLKARDYKISIERILRKRSRR
jgi:FHA domain